MAKTASITLHVGHVVKVRVTKELENAISLAQSSKRGGSTKIDAIRAIYPQIASKKREEIWYVIMNGADLSSRGAVTYYYNMRKEFRSRI
jgi:hypothetical protein